MLPEPETDSPVGLLDVELLRTNVIRDLLGIDELQPDSGADYVPAPNGIDEWCAAATRTAASVS